MSVLYSKFFALPLGVKEVNTHPSTTPQACIIIPDLFLLYTVGEVRWVRRNGERDI